MTLQMRLAAMAQAALLEGYALYPFSDAVGPATAGNYLPQQNKAAAVGEFSRHFHKGKASLVLSRLGQTQPVPGFTDDAQSIGATSDDEHADPPTDPLRDLLGSQIPGLHSAEGPADGGQSVVAGEAVARLYVPRALRLFRYVVPTYRGASVRSTSVYAAYPEDSTSPSGVPTNRSDAGFWKRI